MAGLTWEPQQSDCSFPAVACGSLRLRSTTIPSMATSENAMQDSAVVMNTTATQGPIGSPPRHTYAAVAAQL